MMDSRLSFSSNIKRSIKGFLKKINMSYRQLMGFQSNVKDIGEVTPPYFKRGYMKRSFSQQGEDLSLDRIWTRVFKRDLKYPGKYVDIGSYHPVDHSVTYLMYLRGWSGLVVDASPKSCELHKKQRPRDKVINAVVGSSDLDSVDFYFHKSGKLSLINTKYPDDINNYSKISLPQKNINTILDASGINEIDFLNIDIEGAEMEVLDSLNFQKYKPKIIAVEIHGNDIQKGLKSDVSNKLLEMNYKLVAVNVITYFFIQI
ncbi:FkbM family methyltransferase [Rhodohalobacter sulfatireducens]|uniref:FkbM family methyltransferase n=1 Tax=Rhodohalobacter sulfatireducens TaxID=2911366 RepID=A0ABS9KIX2_9BACT|nr:FkbM family methyltransferase [Rhodohalobacter sulfatireducens]MCG2590783.1 FkbM family methyltransferase [Rhodohalobacter sulfatireducens]